MEPWRESWRAIQPHLPTIGLEALYQAFLTDAWDLADGSYFQSSDLDGHIYEACAVGYTIWKSGYELYWEADDVLTKAFWYDQDLDADFVNWFDSEKYSWEFVKSAMVPEISAELARRSLTVLQPELVTVEQMELCHA